MKSLLLYIRLPEIGSEWLYKGSTYTVLAIRQKTIINRVGPSNGVTLTFDTDIKYFQENYKPLVS